MGFTQKSKVPKWVCRPSPILKRPHHFSRYLAPLGAKYIKKTCDLLSPSLRLLPLTSARGNDARMPITVIVPILERQHCRPHGSPQNWKQLAAWGAPPANCANLKSADLFENCSNWFLHQHYHSSGSGTCHDFLHASCASSCPKYCRFGCEQSVIFIAAFGQLPKFAAAVGNICSRQPQAHTF